MNMCTNNKDDRELSPTDYGGKKLSSPVSPSRKLYSKISNQIKLAHNDRDSPISRKSIDCLLNGEINSQSSTENVKKETNIDDINKDYNNNNSNNQNIYTELSNEFNQDNKPVSYTDSFTSRLTSLRNKLNGSRHSRSQLNSKNEFLPEHETDKNSIQFQNDNSFADRDANSNNVQKDYEISTPNIPQNDTFDDTNNEGSPDVLSLSLNLKPSKHSDLVKNSVGKSMTNVVINNGGQKICSS